ncbi:NFACT RNA binding domain-containing protein [Chryseolinea sp. H1M3-3]|uniref:NFACT RNA binding domain-containing protein n=1 Tax=Chryseolinea sp. H1M3-3 TaxID=3034144 RepID=UPI0023ED200B|nr:NFACT RNA binding domain-containing protein [Chryseolinea sp. H1M3-3]
MHNNYYFLRQLTKSLENTLRSTVVSECFSQSKDELIIRFETQGLPFFIKANLSSSFSCLSFPDSFHRARKNSVDLFQTLIGQRVEGIHQFENERSFAINFSNEIVMLFKMHGNRSNLVLFENGSVTEIFKNSIQEDENIDLQTLDRTIDWSYENFLQNSAKPESLYFTFGKVVWKYLQQQKFFELSTDAQWKAIQDVRDLLSNPSYSIREHEGKMFFSMLEFGNLIRQFTDPIKAVHEFSFLFTHQDTFSKEKSWALSYLKSKLQSSQNFIDKTANKLRELQADNNYKIWADLLMANLHTVKQGIDRVTLNNFYHDNHPTEIKLKRDLSPQKNAAIFYKKGKNQQIEINHLQQLLKNKSEECDKLTDQLLQVEEASDLKTLRKLGEKLKVSDEKEKQPAPVPYREVEYKGYKILIGKNAHSNDTLTLKFGYKEDLWLHAKDVAGSHVLLKYQAGKNFPKDVIERAAQLAAYYSKRKNESLCPVVVTPRKYVRKRKGDLPGTVVVEREEVIMVEPTLDEKS